MPHAASVAVILSLAATPALAVPQVVADLLPTGALVQEVLGDLAEVRILLPQGASAHHHQMRPSDAGALQDADLIVWMGPELTPWLARASDTLAGGEQLRLLQVEGVTLRDYAGSPADAHDDHGQEAPAEDNHGHETHGHEDHADAPAHDDHSGIDPHAWLNPANAGPWLRAIADSLSRQDPDNAATYRNNAQAAAARIDLLDADLQDRLAPYADAQFVVFHDAYGYFTDHFGLRPALPVSLGDASTPSAARIDQLRREIAQTGATCAFPEYAHDGALVQTAIEGSTIRLGGELSPEGGIQASGPGQYDALLTNMAETIIECLARE